MSSSIPRPRFLLDENVHIALNRFLISEKFNVKRARPGAHDASLAELSFTDKRVLVTNDHDFTRFPKNRIFSVIWLRIPQRDVEALLRSFQILMKGCHSFKGRLILLEPSGWKSRNLPVVRALR